MLNYAPRFNRNSITEIIKKMVYLPSAWTIIWLLSYQQLAVLQFLVHGAFLLNKRQTFSYKFHEQVAEWNFELLNPITKDITKSVIEKKNILESPSCCCSALCSNWGKHRCCSLWAIVHHLNSGNWGIQRVSAPFVWITNRRDSEVVCTSLHIALLGLLRHLLTLLKPKQYHLCSGYSSCSDFFAGATYFPTPLPAGCCQWWK